MKVKNWDDVPDVLGHPKKSMRSTVVRPHQLRRGDLITEQVIDDDRPERTVVINSVAHGEVSYRGGRAPVLFVTGRDTRNGNQVVYTRTSWDFMEVTRGA